MIEFRRRPSLGRMAGCAVLTELPGVWIVLFVAREAVLRRSCKVCQRQRMVMALFAGHVLMLSGQRESKTGMTEILLKRSTPS